MRVFWIILTLIIAGSGAVVFMPSPKTNPHPALPAATQSDVIPESAAEIQTPTNDSAETETAPSIESTPTENEIAATTAAGNLEEVAEVTDSIEAVVEEEAVPEFTANDIIANLDSTPDANEIVEANINEADEDSAQSGWKALADETNNEATEETPAPAETVQIPDALPIIHNDDGSMTIGDAYTITGKGTRDNPYVVPWNYLVSLREYYNPREGKKAIPSHIAMFNGKYITIPGYLQFPLATPEPVECLVMLNQWDGCCIGVPPTPYDAIEVSLSEPASREQKFAVEGRIVGKLKIDPYLVGNWLIGLYLLTDASVDVSNTRSVEEVYGNPLPQFDPTTE